ncbi:hypothetical protein RBH29_10060 [Herbivorax sp. ANBcel31]|uniref:hypothetical protein n=1 Tax=Herbivorax sp. ANBcel31 TaxID=3069754 RepID=UPI0027B403B1|nr:hypothetical protein [Herbivorax sp. ANBcel31]MDQ2086770.1 hypothetical protein [Herbivorax sp. ANBcel31]
MTAEMSQDYYGNTTTKVYDKAGRLKYVIDGNASSGTLCATYEYNPNGSIKNNPSEGVERDIGSVMMKISK